MEERYSRQKLNMEFGPLPESKMFYVRRLYITTKKSHYPALIIPQRGSTDAYFGRLCNVFEEKVESHKYASLEFAEDVMGERIEY
mgnify:CR=1 FL=1